MTPVVKLSWIITRDGVGDRRVMTVKLVPFRTVSTTNQRWHWRARHRMAKAQREPTGLVMRTAMSRDPMRLPVDVTLTRIAPRELDDDNLRGALKSVRDGVADALGLDDRNAQVSWDYAQRKGQVRENAVEIRVCSRPA